MTEDRESGGTEVTNDLSYPPSRSSAQEGPAEYVSEDTRSLAP